MDKAGALPVGGEATPQTARCFALFAIGFSERSLDMLKMVIARYGTPQFRFEFAPADEVEILLANGDIFNVASTVGRIREQRPCPTVVLSARPREDIPDTYRLLNPLSPHAFMGTLHGIAASLLEHDKDRDRTGQAASPPPEAPPLFTHTAHPPSATAAKKTAAPEAATDTAWSAEPSAVRRNAAHTAKLLEQDLSPLDNRGGHLHNIDLNNPEQVNGIYFNPDGFLYQYLSDALRAMNGEAGVLEIVIDGQRLVLDFVRNRWSGQFDEQALRGLCLTPLHSRPDIRLLAELPAETQFRGHPELISAQTDFSTNQHAIHSLRTFRAEFILAQIGLWCAHGHLPRGTDLHRPVRLRHWPNIMCLPRTHGAMQLAALWMQAPCSLAQTVERTGLLQRHVFAFYVICDALNLFAEPPADTPTAAEPQPDQKQAAGRGFLRRLLQTVWRPDNDG